MVSSKGEFEWSMTGNLMALTINMNRKKGTSAIKADELNPYIERTVEKTVLNTADSMAILKSVFIKK
jgi:hypothetical protein